MAWLSLLKALREELQTGGNDIGSKVLVLDKVKVPQSFAERAVFLGTWCFEDNISIPSGCVTLKPYIPSSSEISQINKYCREYERVIFPKIIRNLNSTLKIDLSERQWKILIGHWFRRFVSAFTNRYLTLYQALKNSEIEFYASLNTDLTKISSKSSSDAFWKFDEPMWNTEVYSKLIQYMKPELTSIEFEPQCYEKKQKTQKNTIKLFIKKVYSKLLALVFIALPPPKIFIYKSYFPMTYSIILSLLLKQLPTHRKMFADTAVACYNPFTRKQLLDALSYEKDDELEKLFLECFCFSLPTNFFENLKVNLASIPRFKSNPSVFLTAVAFDFDDGFKYLLCNFIEKNTKYLIFQHGNNYGTHSLMWPTVEEETCNYFFTWGWSNLKSSGKYIPVFNQKLMGERKKLKNDSYFKNEKQIIFVQMHQEVRYQLWDVKAKYIDYLKDQKRLISMLYRETDFEITVRPHSALEHFVFNEESYYKEIHPRVEVQRQSAKFKNQLNKFGIILFSYYSTGFIECLALNKPCICIETSHMDFTLDSEKQVFNSLIEANILFTSIEETLTFLTQLNQNGINNWWSSLEVQTTVAAFTQRHSILSNKSLKTFKGLLTKIASEN